MRQGPSTSESISSKFKGGLAKFADALKPNTPVKPADDPVTLSSKGKPRAETHVAVARLFEQSGRLNDAVKHYQKALDATPDYLGALLGLARTKSRMNQPEAALKLYQRAAKAHSNQASVHNNLGAFYGTRGMFKESVQALNRAIQLQPKKANYRANIAVVLVHLGRTEEAFTHLRTAYGEAVAYYNMGFLLKGEGQTRAAADHFATALRIDPSLQQARYWLEQLHCAPMEARTPTDRPPSDARLGRRTTRPPTPTRSGAPAGPVSRNTGRNAAVRQLPPPPRNPSMRSRSPAPGRGHSLPNPVRSSSAEPVHPLRLPPVSRRAVRVPALDAPIPTVAYHARATQLAAPLPDGSASQGAD